MVDVIVFSVAAIIILGGAIGVILSANPVHASLNLVASFFGVAVLFVLQEAHFLALVQVVVYGGAIVVLFLFVIMLLGVDKLENLQVEPLAYQRIFGFLGGIGFFVLILGGLFLSGPGGSEGAVAITGNFEVVVPIEHSDGAVIGASIDAPNNIQQLARDIFGRNVLVFEATALLLTIATIGAVVMVKNHDKPIVDSNLADSSAVGDK